MEQRKRKEIEHYDKKAEELSRERVSVSGDFEGFDSRVLASYKFCYDWLKNNCQNKKVLDYGCGEGLHSVFLAKTGAEKVFAIDLSEKSLVLAGERARKEGMAEKIEFLKMDCEKMDFPDNFFDVIFDGGTFSSLDINLVLPELARVLKSEGALLGIETFGHNPLTNLKRKLNKLTGKRTGWAAGHIFKTEDLEKAKKYFNKIEIKYFHLVSWAIFPFLGLPGVKFLLKLAEIKDNILLKAPFLRKYAFKVVFVFSQPKK